MVPHPRPARGQRWMIDYLVEENRVLREQLGKRRVLSW
jgi:hypothetical protein